MVLTRTVPSSMWRCRPGSVSTAALAPISAPEVVVDLHDDARVHLPGHRVVLVAAPRGLHHFLQLRIDGAELVRDCA